VRQLMFLNSVFCTEPDTEMLQDRRHQGDHHVVYAAKVISCLYSKAVVDDILLNTMLS